MDLRALEFQHEQVSSQLIADPNNASLQALAKKLEALIKMTKDVEPPKPQPKLAPKALVPKLVELAVGDLCEAKYEADGGWWEAKVQSVVPDKSSCTVIFTGMAGTQHCSPHMLRKHSGSTKKYQELPKKPSVPVPVSAIPSTSKPAASSTGKRKHTLAEHRQKKEAEHAAKQQNWQSFQKRVGSAKPGDKKPY